MRGPSICLCFFYIFGNVQSALGQYAVTLPSLFPSYANHFYEGSAAYANKCYSEVFLDLQGRLWLNICGRERGLNSVGIFLFDGYQFQPISFQTPDHRKLMQPSILGIDRAGQMFGETNSNQVYLMDTDARTCRLIPRADSSTADFKIHGCSFIDGQIQILGSASDCLLLLQVQDGVLIEKQRFPYSSGFWGFGKHPFCQNEQDVWLMGGQFPLFRIDRKSGTSRTYDTEDFIPTISKQLLSWVNSRNIPRILECKGGDLFVFLPKSYGSHFYRFDLLKDKFLAVDAAFSANWQPADLFKDEVGNICFLFQDSQGHYRAVLEAINGQRYNYSPVVADQSGIFSLAGKDFRHQVFIVGENGLHCIGIKKENAITTILPGQWVSTAAELPDGRFLINTVLGDWYIHDLKTGKTLPFQAPGSNLTPAPFANGMKQQVIPDGEGVYWFTSKTNLIGFHPGINMYTSFGFDGPISLINLVRKDLMVVQRSARSFSFFDLKKGEPVSFGPEVATELNAHIRDFFTDSKKHLWVCTNNGLWQIDFEKRQSKRFGIEDGFTDDCFTSMYEDLKGRLWVGTYLGGVQILDPATGVIKVVNQNQGLSNNAVMSILADHTNTVWVATEHGINLVSQEGQVLNAVHREDGLCYERFERFDPMKSSTGMLWFGSHQGMNIIDPELVKSSLITQEPVQIYLTELAYFDKNQNKEQIQHHKLNNLETLEIPADYPYIRVKFSLSSYLEPQLNHYSYQLEGIDQDWRFLGVHPELNIPRLPPGNYRLLITGSDFRNNQAIEPLVIHIHAQDFFYKQAWFYILCCLPFLLFGLIWARNKHLEARRLEVEVIRRTEKIQSDKVLIEKQAEELQQLDNMKSQFFTNISHELRTPITLITAPLEHLIQKQGNSLAKSVQNSLRLVLKNGQKLGRLVEELLELSRIDAKKATLYLVPTPLDTFCRHLFHAYYSGAALKRIDYSFHSELPAEAHFLVDRNRLEKVVNNLLSNSLKFTPPNGKVQMKVSHQEGYIAITVADTGRGIPEEDLPFVFDRYFQSNQENIAMGGGTGIGLALSRELAYLMKGELSVESTWGKGSTFTLHIPVQPVSDDKQITPVLRYDDPVSAEEETEHNRTATQHSSPGTEKPRLLIVEDNPDMQDLLYELLSENYACMIANHGAEAWALLDARDASIEGTDLILSDVMMPEMDGYNLLEKVKEDTFWQHLPFILLTARAEEEDKLQALRMGVDDYLIKPFSPAELLARVRNLIANYRVRKQFNVAATNTNKAGIHMEFETLPSADYTWLKEVEKAAKYALDKRLKLTTAQLSGAVFLSDRQFSRKLQSLTGLSPQAYLLEVKLQKARHLLECRTYVTIAEVAQSSGFASMSHFTKAYREYFGKLPKDYL